MYSDKPAFSLEGGEKIVEEEEGDDDATTTNNNNAPFTPAKSSPANSPGKSSNASTSLVADSVSTIAKRRKFEDAKEELLSLAKGKSIGLREVKMEFAKSTTLKRVDCRRKFLALGFKTDDLSDDTFNVLFSGMDVANNGSIYTDEILRLFEREIEEDQMACEVPDMEDDDVPEKLYQDGILEISVVAAKDLVTQTQRAHRRMQRTVHFPAAAFSANEVARRRQLVRELCEQHSALAAQLGRFLKRSGLLLAAEASAIRKQSARAQTHDATFQFQQSTAASASVATPVETFFALLEKLHAARATRIDDSATTSFEAMMRSPYLESNNSNGAMNHRGSIASPVGLRERLELRLPSKTAANALDLHKTERMRALETKRRDRLAHLQRQKQLALGDKQKTAALPRLIGGRKSGSTHVSCVDCGARVLVCGRSDASTDVTLRCAGSNCTSVFCKPCFALLPAKKPFCEDCFQHELVPLEAFGEQLRALLIEKVGSSGEQRAHLDAIFASFDTDRSGALSAEEFSRALDQLGIQPALSDEQRASLLAQFDANKDGEISPSEFRDWIVKHQVWSPTSHATSSLNRFQGASGNDGADKVTPDVLASTIAPALEEILNAALDACVFSSSTDHWMRTRNSTKPNTLRVMHDPKETHQPHQERSEAVLFMRTMNLAMSDTLDGGGSYSPTVAAKVFEHFDADRSGRIDQDEFTTFVRALGLHLDDHDAQLLMRRIESSSADGSVGFATFMAYVERMMLKTRQATTTDASTRPSASPLADVIVQMDALVANDPLKRERLCDIVQQLQSNARETETMRLCRQLRDAIGLHVSTELLQRLANALHLREVQPGSIANATTRSVAPDQPRDDNDALLELKSSGDVLTCVLFSIQSTVIAQLHRFDLAAICASVSAFLEQQSGGASSSASVWKVVLGLEPTEAIDQRDFLDILVRAGYTLEPTTSNASLLLTRLTTKLHVAFALDALRSKSGSSATGRENATVNGAVTFSLFTVLMRFTKILAIEASFDLALVNFVRLCQGHQHYLVTVALDHMTHALRVCVREPIFKFAMDFVLDEHEYARSNLLSHFPLLTLDSRSNDRDRALPGPLGTATTCPEVESAMLALLARLRIAANANTTTTDHQGMIPFLKLVESDAFVATLRSLLAQANLPFFWCVSPKVLEFSIDGDYLEQLGRPSFQHVVAEALARRSSSSRALISLLKHTSSSLQVRYEVVGKHAVFLSSWETFQAVLAGHQDTYAVVEVCPQGDVFATDVDRTGTSGAASWRCTKKIVLNEPETCDQRIDRPVVYTDTVKVSAVPGAQSTKAITFVVDDDRSDASSGHFVVLSVRKAQPTGRDVAPRLYCTAYDPFTSCEYAVEGYPPNWPVDFFSTSGARNVEREWTQVLKTMRLGATLTPKVVVKVFNKQAKTEKLIGECEVSIGSAIAHEGHLVDDWFALQHPIDSLRTTGFVNLSFRFDVQKASEIPLALAQDAPGARRRSSVVPVEISAMALAAPTESAVETATTDSDSAATAVMEARVRELQQSLNASESAKRDAVEQVRALRSQLQHVSMSASSMTDTEVLKWKSKLDQALQEQSRQQDEHGRRYGSCVCCWSTNEVMLSSNAVMLRVVWQRSRQSSSSAKTSRCNERRSKRSSRYQLSSPT